MERFEEGKLSQVVNLLSNLEVFGANGTAHDTATQMITSLSSKLKAVRSIIKLNGFLRGDHSFNLLEEIKLGARTECPSILKKLRESSHGLKRIGLDWIPMRDTERAPANPLITDLLSKQKDLEQLVVKATMDQFDDICNAIDRGVFNIAESRDTLQLKLLMKEEGTQRTAGDLEYGISKIVAQLHASPHISQFLIMFRRWNTNEDGLQGSWEEAMCKLNERNHGKFEISYTNNDCKSEQRLLLTNKGCKIAGRIQHYLYDDWLIGRHWFYDFATVM